MIGLLARFVSFRLNDFIRLCLVLVFSCTGFVFAAQTTHAATFYLTPSSGSYTVGNTFTVNVMVKTSNQAVNAYSGVISYPADKLEMMSIGKGGSIVSFWVQQPSFSAGRASFEGITFNPGYTGEVGKIAVLTFKVKATGTASVRFVSGSVLANDGAGTNVLKGMGSATFALIGIGVKPLPAPPTPTEAIGLPAIPQIRSDSHPDSSLWYASKNVMFRWELEKGVSGVSSLLDQNPVSDPGMDSDGLFSTSTYENVPDGVGYFHLRVRNQSGWSGKSNFQFQIDSTKPDSFTIVEVQPDDSDRMTKAFTFNAIDAGSGIDHYEIQIDGGATTTWVDDGTRIYHTVVTSTGDHTMSAKAFDHVGNFLETTVKFTIEDLAIPQITEYPLAPVSGDDLVVKGIAILNSTVSIWIQKEQDLSYSRQILSDAKGRFAFIAEDTLEQASYQIWATVADNLGNVSQPSEKITIIVKPRSPDFWTWLVSFLLNYRFVLTILFLLVLLTILFWKYILLRRKMKRDERNMQEARRKAFELLKTDIQNQVKMLEQIKSIRELTIEEERILGDLKKDLEATSVDG